MPKLFNYAGNLNLPIGPNETKLSTTLANSMIYLTCKPWSNRSFMMQHSTPTHRPPYVTKWLSVYSVDLSTRLQHGWILALCIYWTMQKPLLLVQNSTCTTSNHSSAEKQYHHHQTHHTKTFFDPHRSHHTVWVFDGHEDELEQWHIKTGFLILQINWVDVILLIDVVHTSALLPVPGTRHVWLNI